MFLAEVVQVGSKQNKEQVSNVTRVVGKKSMLKGARFLDALPITL